MPQMGFYVGGVGAGVFGLPIGVIRVFLAWDPLDGGAKGAMYQVYEWMSPASIIGGARIRNFEPIKIAKLPQTGKYFGLELKTIKFKIDSTAGPGGGYSDVADFTLEVYGEDSSLIYSVSGAQNQPLKVPVKGILTSAQTGFQGRVSALDFSEESTKKIFKALMTRDGPGPPWNDGGN